MQKEINEYLNSDLIFDKLNLTWRLSKISYFSEEADLDKLVISLPSWNLCSNSAELLSHESSSVVKSGLWRAMRCNLSYVFGKHNETKERFISTAGRCNWPFTSLGPLWEILMGEKKNHRKIYAIQSELHLVTQMGRLGSKNQDPMMFRCTWEKQLSDAPNRSTLGFGV